VYGPKKVAGSPPHCPYKGAPLVEVAAELVVLVLLEDALVDDDAVVAFVVVYTFLLA
jgi:hypothetical protein